MDTILKILGIIAVIIIVIALGFGCNALIVWIVCKIMGWTFAWKWVVLFTIVYALLAGLFRQNK